MRILWFKPILPYPPRQGTSRVTLQLLDAFRGEHTIRLVAPLRAREEREAARALEVAHPGVEVRDVLAPNRRSPFHRAWYRAVTARGAARGVPPIEGYIAARPLRDRFAAEARDFAPDLVVVEYWYAAAHLAAAAGRPAVLFAHDLEYRLREQGQAGTRHRVRSARWGALEIRREKEALATAPFLWFLTEADRDGAVADCGVDPRRTAVVPYGVDLHGTLRPRDAADPPENPDTVLFFGSFTADFNQDALVFVLEAIWPAIRRRTPRAALRIAGGGLPDALAARARAAGAEVVGEVADVRAALLAAAVVLVPLRFGGGLRIRLLEALALGRAVVGTPTGVLGMGPRDGREVVAATSADELAAATARLLDDAKERSALGAAGRAFVEARHAPGAASAAQRAVLAATATRVEARG